MYKCGKQLFSFFVFICSMKQVEISTSTMGGFDMFTIVFDVLISIVGSLAVNRLIPILKEKFIKAQLWGYDLNKRNSKEIKM